MEKKLIIMTKKEKEGFKRNGYSFYLISRGSVREKARIEEFRKDLKKNGYYTSIIDNNLYVSTEQSLAWKRRNQKISKNKNKN